MNFLVMRNIENKIEMKLGQHSYERSVLLLCFNIVMYRNLDRKSSFRSCPYTVLVKCPVRFYSIFDEIGQNVDGKMHFYHKSHCSTIQQNPGTASERQRSVYLRPRTDMRRKIAQNVFPL